MSISVCQSRGRKDTLLPHDDDDDDTTLKIRERSERRPRPSKQLSQQDIHGRFGGIFKFLVFPDIIFPGYNKRTVTFVFVERHKEFRFIPNNKELN